MVNYIFDNRLILIFIFLLLCILLLIAGQSKKKYIFKIIIVSSILLLIILSSFCDFKHANDLNSYERMFLKIKNLSLFEVISLYKGNELGFYLLNKIVSYWGNFTMFRIFCSSIIYYFLYKLIAIENNKKLFLIGITSYLSIQFLNSFNILRQSIAVIIFVYAFSKYLKDKKMLHYYSYCFMASCFHISAIVAFLVGHFCIGIYKIKSNYLKFLLALSCIFIAISFEQLFSILISSIDAFDKYSFYLSMNNSTTNYVFFIDCLVMIMYIFICKNNNISVNNIYTYMLLVCCCSQALGFYGVYMKRIALYFETLQVITFMDIRKRVKNNNLVFIYIYIIIRFTLFTFRF